MQDEYMGKTINAQRTGIAYFADCICIFQNTNSVINLHILNEKEKIHRL
jgi:hypothetical protein